LSFDRFNVESISMTQSFLLQVDEAAQGLLLKTGDDARGPLIAFLRTFVAAPFVVGPGTVIDSQGNQSEPFAAVIALSTEGTGESPTTFHIDKVAAVIDFSETLGPSELASAHDRIAAVKRFSKAAKPISAKGRPRTEATLGIILAGQTNLPLEDIAAALDKLHGRRASEWPDIVAISSVGTISYGAHFPGQSINPFLLPTDDVLRKFIPPMYVVALMSPSGLQTITRTLGLLLAHIAIFEPDVSQPKWIELLGIPKHVVTLTGYQFSQSGDLLAAPAEAYVDRYVGPAPVYLDGPDGKEVGSLTFIPWLDGGVVRLTGKLPLEGLLVFFAKEVLSRSGVVPTPNGQLSYALPITEATFKDWLVRIRRQTNLKVRSHGASWTVKKVADEGSASPYIARLFIGILRLRDQAFAPANRSKFDQAYELVTRSLDSARMAAREYVAFWNKHRAQIEDGSIVKVTHGNMHVSETVDKQLRQNANSFLNAATRTLKKGMQSLVRDLGVELGFLFQKQVAFDTGLAVLRQQDPLLADFILDSRTWTEKLISARNAVEHEDWMLADVKYERSETGVVALEPLIQGESASEFIDVNFDHLLCFVEDVTAYCLQNKLPTDLALSETPIPERRADMPERFRLTLRHGGAKAWTIAPSKLRFDES
jgi:hypothetical protein